MNYLKTEWDPAEPYTSTYTGLLEKKILVGDRERRILIYIPEGARADAAGVFIFPESGKTAEQTYKESLWKVTADTDLSLEKVILTFLEPESTGWRTDEPYGCEDGDVAYAQKVFEYWNGVIGVPGRVHESRFYLYGCREGGTIASMFAMYNPANFAGMVSIGAPEVPAAYQNAAASDFCQELHMMTDPKCHIKKNEIAMPVWLIQDPLYPASDDVNTDSTSPETTSLYWRKSCGVDAFGCQISPDTWEYRRTKEVPHPSEDDIEAFVVRESWIPGRSEDHGNRLIPGLWNTFLRRHRRWCGNPEGCLRKTEDPAGKSGMEYHYEEIAGCLREWYVYVPETVRQHPDQKVPLVVAIHGMACSGAVYAGDSGWDRVADQYGIIVVFPSAVYNRILTTELGLGREDSPRLPSWNFLHDVAGPDELAFFRSLIARVSDTYPVDQTRIYATGHSHGSMMTQVLGMACGDLFTAVAPCSGVLMRLFSGPTLLELPEVAGRSDVPVPCWMFVGENEKWLMPDVPAADNMAGEAVMAWRRINHITPEIPENWEAGWNSHGRWHDLFYTSPETGCDVRFTRIEHMGHAVLIEQTFRIWEEFFSRYARENGRINYHEG